MASIPSVVDWPVSFPFKFAVEYMSATGLLPETIISMLSNILGGRLSYYKNSYVKIVIDMGTLGIILETLQTYKGHKIPWEDYCYTQSYHLC